MIELDRRLLAVRETAREQSADLRGRALAIDADPEAMEAHFDSPLYATVRRAETPPEFREAGPWPVESTGGSSLRTVLAFTEIAYGDAGSALACPAPGLAGVVVRVLGDRAQQELFFRRLHGGRTWPFFAMTEPRHGSDAEAMETRFEPDGSGGWLLYGKKKFVGNAARGGVGVVFGRTGRSAMSIRAALVELPAPGWTGRRLETVGLRGAFLSELEFDGVPVPGEMMLGGHLPATQRGLWGAVKTFNQVRLQVAAAAVGTALAITDYVGEHHKSASGLAVASARALAARESVYEGAVRIDRDPRRGYWSSAVKLGAVRMAIETGRWAQRVLGPGGLLEHPLLEKWTRDVCAFEFMDGTSNIQRLNVERGYRKGDADA